MEQKSLLEDRIKGRPVKRLPASYSENMPQCCKEKQNKLTWLGVAIILRVLILKLT